MKAAVIPSKGGKFEIQTLPIPTPGSDQVRIRVHACGICHGDHYIREGLPPAAFPRILGHEVAGVIDSVGSSVDNFKIGDRVAVGWAGGHCFKCEQWRRGKFIFCKSAVITGATSDGGYAEYMIARVEAVARIPDELSFAEAAPLVCAGLTVFNSLRNSVARPGDVVAVSGIGGLGHLGIQFANKMGFKVVAISSGDSKRELALSLGAHVYVDSSKEDPSQALLAHGGAKVALCTAPSSKTMSDLVNGLDTDSTMIIVGASHDSITANPLQLIHGNKSISGWASGAAVDSEDTMKFAVLSKTKSINEVFPLEKVNEAFERMMSNQVKFRIILDLSPKN